MFRSVNWDLYCGYEKEVVLLLVWEPEIQATYTVLHTKRQELSVFDV